MGSYRLAMSPAILYFVTTKSLAMVNSSLSDSESDIFRVFDLNSLTISFFRYYFSFDGSEIIDCVNVAVLKPVHFFYDSIFIAVLEFCLIDFGAEFSLFSANFSWVSFKHFSVRASKRFTYGLSSFGFTRTLITVGTFSRSNEPTSSAVKGTHIFPVLGWTENGAWIWIY